MRHVPARSARFVVALCAVLAAGACGYSSGYNEECAEGFTNSAKSVEGVVSVEFECGGSFGNPHQRGSILVEAQSQEEANSIIDNIYRGFAGDPEINGADRPVIEFESSISGERFDDRDLGFNGSPSVSQMRERYCGDMDCASGVKE